MERRRLAVEDAYRAAVKYVDEISATSKLDVHYATAVCSCILCSHMALPVKTIIVAERPYRSKIHPIVSSCMSYDEKRSGPTPSTRGVAMDLSLQCGADYEEVEAWTRDGWKQLRNGVLFVNCIDGVVRSMDGRRSKVSKKACHNPAIIAKYERGDPRSRSFTLNNKSASTSIFKAIQRTRTLPTTSISEYISEMSDLREQSMQAITDVAVRTQDFYDQLEHAYQAGGINDNLPPLKRAKDEFIRSLYVFKDTVVQAAITTSLMSDSGRNQNVAKPAEWGNKRDWCKSGASTTTGSYKMLSPSQGSTSEPVVGAIKFLDGVPGGDSRPVTPSKPPRKAMSVASLRSVASVRTSGSSLSRRVSRSIAPVELESHQCASLRIVCCYLADANTPAATVVSGQLEAAIENSRHSSGVVGSVLEAIRIDAAAGKKVEECLGTVTGTVDQTSQLYITLGFLLRNPNI
ncbi:hypothetical protein K3495_g12968 [Podosphaera aphanis]|nr:hypothetical protein K3495_g12968 [Podosphaera aphanis]